MLEESLIVSDVADELRAEPALHADRISVSASNGVIVLAGSVDSSREKDLAEQAALRIKGVQAVANELTVDLPAAQERSDQEIAEAAALALQWNSAVPAEAVQLAVDGGWVTLYGTAAWQFERLAAEGAIRNLTGVRGITNLITPPRRPAVSNITSLIADGLKRSAAVDARHIAIDEHDGRVLLRGTARSWIERSEAERIAWTIPGVSAVENQIAIGRGTSPGESGVVLDHIERSGALPAGVAAGEAAAATLCALSLRVSGDEIRELTRLLPSDVSGLLRPCARHREAPAEVFDRKEFLRRVGEHLVVSEQESERLTRAVFEAVRMWLPGRDVHEIATQLPEDLRDLWHVVPVS
jgi:osmotically-inducible protein OsmY